MYVLAREEAMYYCTCNRQKHHYPPLGPWYGPLSVYIESVCKRTHITKQTSKRDSTRVLIRIQNCVLWHCVRTLYCFLSGLCSILLMPYKKNGRNLPFPLSSPKLHYWLNVLVENARTCTSMRWIGTSLSNLHFRAGFTSREPTSPCA